MFQLPSRIPVVDAAAQGRHRCSLLYHLIARSYQIHYSGHYTPPTLIAPNYHRPFAPTRVDPSSRNSVWPLGLCTCSRASPNSSLCGTWPGKVQNYRAQLQRWSSGGGSPSPSIARVVLSATKKPKKKLGMINRSFESEGNLFLILTFSGWRQQDTQYS